MSLEKRRRNTCGSKNRIYSSVQGTVLSDEKSVTRKDHRLPKKDAHSETIHKGTECQISGVPV